MLGNLFGALQKSVLQWISASTVVKILEKYIWRSSFLVVQASLLKLNPFTQNLQGFKHRIWPQVQNSPAAEKLYRYFWVIFPAAAYLNACNVLRGGVLT